MPTDAIIHSYNPATGLSDLQIPDSSASDVNLAVKCAQEAFKSWSKTSVQERSALLNKIADVLESRLQEFVLDNL